VNELLENSPLHIKNFDKFVEIREQVVKEVRKHGKNQHYNSLTTEMRNEVDKLREDGLSYIKIGEKLGISRSAVSGIVYRARLSNRKYKY
jgi:DNA-directed RNA polymerase specialized sigma24 family protein